MNFPTPIILLLSISLLSSCTEEEQTIIQQIESNSGIFLSEIQEGSKSTVYKWDTDFKSLIAISTDAILYSNGKIIQQGEGSNRMEATYSDNSEIPSIIKHYQNNVLSHYFTLQSKENQLNTKELYRLDDNSTPWLSERYTYNYDNGLLSKVEIEDYNKDGKLLLSFYSSNFLYDNKINPITTLPESYQYFLSGMLASPHNMTYSETFMWGKKIQGTSIFTYNSFSLPAKVEKKVYDEQDPQPTRFIEYYYQIH